MLRVLLFSFIIIISCPLASYRQQINISGDRFHLYGPNSTGNEYLKIGGNGRGPGHASLVTTNGNLFIDSKNERELYLNHHSRRNTYINPSGGNVGIGTFDPKSRLEVNGAIRSRSNILAANPSNIKNCVQVLFLTRATEGGTGESWMFMGKPEVLNRTWTLIERLVPGDSVHISGSNILIDELRLHPVRAFMSTYTYDPLAGITSKSDARNRTLVYVYDGSGRLSAVKNEEDHILELFGYNYVTGTSN